MQLIFPMIAQIAIIVKIQDQLVGVQQDYFIMQNKNHDPSFTHHVELAFKGHLIVFQHAMNFQIEYQKEQHVYLYRTLYNFRSLLSQLFNLG
ncbi:unnamed protein product [Paramecium pentaurelia]|uniref:Uncharacterized protein n=1 Tax=Paramecium pentaurelia TaxID=43138 RepID=A0A8S1VG41_9CILI|nr:unnamed protein product [Paramecium pentaurelia]